MLQALLIGSACFLPPGRWALESRPAAAVKRTVHTRLVLADAMPVARADAQQPEYLVGPIDVGCASAWLERHPQLPHARMVVVAQNPPMTDESVLRFLAFVQQVLERGQPWSLCWDVQGRAFPSMAQFRLVMDWLEDGRAEQWDEQNQAIVAIVPNPIVRGAAKVLKAIADPPHPTRICKDDTLALSFVRESGKE